MLARRRRSFAGGEGNIFFGFVTQGGPRYFLRKGIRAALPLLRFALWRGGEVNSFAPPGLVLLETWYPRLAPWATVWRRSAPGRMIGPMRWMETRRESRLQRFRNIFFAAITGLRSRCRAPRKGAAGRFAWAGMSDAVGVAKSARSGPPERSFASCSHAGSGVISWHELSDS